MANSSISSSSKRSWADVVKGSNEGLQPNKLKPGKRGELSCHCYGEVLVMLAHYGWIMVHESVQGFETRKANGCRVRVHKRDVAKGVTLASGDVASFYLYIDDQGLCAECCNLEKGAPSRSSGVADDASTTVPNEFDESDEKDCLTDAYPDDSASIGTSPWNLSAEEFVPQSLDVTSIGLGDQNHPAGPPPSMNADAEEFNPSTHCSDRMLLGFEECGQTAKGWQNLAGRIAREFAFASLEEFGQTVEGWQMLGGRMGKTFNLAADEFVPQFKTFAINPAYLSDDGDDESIAREDNAGIEGDNESDHESQEGNESVINAFEDILGNGANEDNEKCKESREDTHDIHKTSPGKEHGEGEVEVMSNEYIKDVNKASSDTDKDTCFNETSDIDSRARSSSEDDTTSAWTPSDAEALDEVFTLVRPPPGLSLPPWRQGKSSKRDSEKEKTSRALPPWRLPRGQLA